jgi:hypothetical protein
MGASIVDALEANGGIQVAAQAWIRSLNLRNRQSRLTCKNLLGCAL